MFDASLPAPFTAPNALPLHARIREALRAGIAQRRWADGKLPSEAELMQQYGVSRITVRQALQALEHQGLVVKVQGKGTYVAPPKPFQHLGRLQGFAEAMHAQGHSIENLVLAIERQSATPAHAQALQLDEGAPLTFLKRLRRLDGRPVSLDCTWLPRALGDRVAEADLAHRDVFLILEQDLGVPLGHADLSFDTVSADPDVARWLELEPGHPVLRIERLTHDRRGHPIDHERLYCRTDNFQFRLRVDRQVNVVGAASAAIDGMPPAHRG